MTIRNIALDPGFGGFKAVKCRPIMGQRCSPKVVH